MDHDEDEGRERSGNINKRIDFSKEVRCLLYGFGDDPNPYTETVSKYTHLLNIYKVGFLSDFRIYS